MWVKGVRDSSGQIGIARCRAHARNVEIGLLQVAPGIAKDLLNVCLGIRMMNEFRLEVSEDGSVLLGGHLILRQLRVKGTKCITNHATGVLDERARTRRCRINEQLTLVN